MMNDDRDQKQSSTTNIKCSENKVQSFVSMFSNAYISETPEL